MRLQTEQDTPKMERKVMSAAIGLLQLNPQETCSAKNYDKGHHHLAVFFEHGQWWAMCNDCGAQWSAVDCEGGRSVEGFDFELVTKGEED
jgi:hypothetical protein